jgi:hypothetical protein
MALLHFDGFDLDDRVLRYPLGAGQNTSATATRFSSGRCVRARSGGELLHSFTAISEIFLGIAFTTNGTANGFVTFLGDAGATSHITVQLGITGAITVRRGNTTGTIIASAAAGTLPAGGWSYVEMRVTISDTVGVVQVRVNGSTTNVINFSGDTKNAGTATTIDRILLTSSSSAVDAEFDDLYICDTAGAAPYNTWLGDVRVATLFPTAAGNSTQLTSSSGGANWTNVDESPRSDADYNFSATVGQKDTYACADLPGTITDVYAVQEIGVALKSDAGAASMRPILRSGGTDYAGTTVALGTTATLIPGAIRTTDPATAATWTVANVNAVQVGAEVQ